MARLRIEFSGANAAREKEKFEKELIDNDIGYFNVGHPSFTDLLADELELFKQVALRSLLEFRSSWTGVGPVCCNNDSHGATTAAYSRAVRSNENHVWKCLAAGCGWSEPVQGSGFITLMEWNNQLQRELNNIQSKHARRVDELWLEALKESQRYFNKNMDQFSNVNGAMTHMRQGGQINVPEALLGVDYSYIEMRVLEIFRHALQTGEQLVVAMKDKVHEPMKHVLPLSYFEEKKRELRNAAKDFKFSDALGVYKPWESIENLKKRLGELEGMSKIDRYRAIYGGMTEHEKSQRLRTDEPNHVGQIPRDPKWGEDVFDAARRRGVTVNQEKLMELERKVAIDTETSGPLRAAPGAKGMVAYNPAYDMKVLEGMAIGVDKGGGDDHAIAMVMAVFPELNKKLADNLSEIESLKKIIERQDRDIDALGKNQDDKHWLSDEHIKLFDEIFMFFAGLNLQDHAVAEQRRYLELMRKFKTLMLGLREAAKIP